MSSLPVFVLIEKLEESIDASHELAPDLGPGAFNIVHGYSPFGSVGKSDACVFDGGDFAVKEAHSIDERAAPGSALNQPKPARHPRLPYSDSRNLYSTAAAGATLTRRGGAKRIRAMLGRAIISWLVLGVFATASASGCGLFYQAGKRMKVSRMSGELRQGDSMAEIHNRFGEPDLRQYPNEMTEIWSYAYKPNTNDITATLLYTSTKEGDQSTFLDLKFVNGRLVSWTEAEHMMPAKERSGFAAGIGAPPISGPGPSNGPITHY